MSGNSPFMRGIVKELDEKGSRARVEFQHEDGVQSFWLSISAGSATGMKTSRVPRIGQQVGCLVDWRGEDGMILGGLYSDEDKPPTTAKENDHTKHEDGAVVEHDPVTGVHRVQLPASGKLLLDAGGSKIMITSAGIVSNKPITVAAIPDIPLRGQS